MITHNSDLAVSTPVSTPALVITPTTPEIIKTTKPKLDLANLIPPTGVKIEIKKCGAKISNDKMKIWVKGSTLEFSNPENAKDPRTKTLTKEEITKAHLGSMKAILKGIKDMADLQTIINNYFG